MQKPTALLVRLSHQLKQDIQKIAKINRRPTSEEVRIALERHRDAAQNARPS